MLQIDVNHSTLLDTFYLGLLVFLIHVRLYFNI